MSKKSLIKFGPAVLVFSLVLNTVFVSCGADAVTTPTPQGQDAEILAQLLSITQRLDSLDARSQRIEANTEAGADMIVTALSDPNGDFLTALSDTGGTFLDALSLGITASLSRSTEVCANLQMKMGAEAEYGTSGEGKARGAIGPNVLEALLMGDVKVQTGAGYKAAAGIEGSVSLAACGAAEVALEGGVDLKALLSLIRSSLATRGMDGPQLQTLTNSVATDVGSSYTGGLATIRAALPALPSGLQSGLDNPIAILANSPVIRDFGIDNQCNTALFAGSAGLTDMQTRLCALNVPTAEDYIAIVNGLSGLPTTLSTLQLGQLSNCNKINQMVPKNLTIPARSVTILGTSYQTFQGYTARLFPAVPTLTC